MKEQCLKYIIIGIIIIFNKSVCFGQIIDLERDNPYRKVFVETDNFGASYLQIIEDNLDKIDVDTIHFSMLNDLAYYWHTRNLITSLKFAKNGLNRAREKKNKLWEGRFKITQGAILLRMEKLDSALLVLESAKHSVKKTDLAFLNTQLGYVYERKGELDRSADFALESLRLGEECHDNKAIALAYSDLSNLFWKQSKFEKGLEFGLKSLKIFEERNINDLDYDFTLYVVGNNYLELKKYTEAINFYNHSISIGLRYGFYNNLCDVYISLVNLYSYLNKYKEAEEAGEMALKYARLLDNNFMLMRSWLSIGKLEHLEGKYISAIRSLEQSIEIATENFGDAYYLSQAYGTLGKAYAGNHNYKNAYQAFAKYDKLKNRIFTSEADHRISLLQTEFEVAQKESTIQVQENELKKQKTRQTLVTIIAGLLFLLLFLLFITFRINRKKNSLLQKQNREKEFLLKEIHHRVKNNLGIVSSLLALQSEHIKDPKVVEIMQESQNRVYSMSMIHQKLYLGKNLAAIEMKAYFVNLGSHVLESFGAEDRILLKYNMGPLDMDIDSAIPIGLIVNELLTNALKYAFPENRKGNIIIGLHKVVANEYKLEFADDGIGIQPDQMFKGTGFGTKLINLLIQQMDGKMIRKNEFGTSVLIEFRINDK